MTDEKSNDINNVNLSELPAQTTILRLIKQSDLSLDLKEKLAYSLECLHHWRQYVAPRVAADIIVVKAEDSLKDRALLVKGFFETNDLFMMEG
jgi:hypothetical protein